MAAPPMIPSLRLSNQIANEEPRTTTTSRPARRVRWASENNLCQVRLFVAEEPPFHAGQTELQDQLQAKKRIAFDTVNSETPPGFDINPLAQRSQEILNSPQTTWKQPPRFVINPLWQVVAGDESEEVKTESQREVRNLEAIYPRLSAIPPCPAVPQETNENNDFREPPLIPLIPIEELEDLQEQVAASQVLDVGDRNFQGNTISNDNGNFSDTTEASSVSNIRIDQSLNIGSSQADTAIKPDIAAAAAATAFHAIMKSNEQGSMIDRDLLIKILANPTILESFLGQHIKSTDNNTTSNIPIEINSNVILRSQNHDTMSVSQAAEPETKFPFTCQTHTSCGNPTVHNNNGAIQNYSSLLQAAEPKAAAAAFATSEAYDFNNARTNMKMMMPGTSIPIPTAHGLPNSQMTSRSGLLPTPSPAPTSAAVSQAAPPPKMNPQPIYPTDEQHYLKLKNLIQEHGYKNDHVQNGLQHLRNECYANGLQQQQHSSSFERGVAPVQSVGTTCTTHPAVVMGETTGGGRIITNKQQKRCIYFNTARGCRRGATCLYLHEAAAAGGGEWPRGGGGGGGVDESDMQMQMPPAKRPKLEIEASSVH